MKLELEKSKRHLCHKDLSKPVVWDVIEKPSGVFRDGGITGYIPRDVLTQELGIDMTRKYTWFNREESAAIRAHPLFQTEKPL